MKIKNGGGTRVQVGKLSVPEQIKQISQGKTNNIPMNMDRTYTTESRCIDGRTNERQRAKINYPSTKTPHSETIRTQTFYPDAPHIDHGQT